MGTNYYLRYDVCQHCGRSDKQLHIGKSSAGWCFALHVHPEEGINTLEDWRREWAKPGTAIYDEYGGRTHPDEMLEIITIRSFARNEIPYGYMSREDFCRQNHAVPGPNGLSRHAIDTNSCIGHGEGTWDYIVGEFS